MPGEVRGLKHGAEWTKVTERAVRCDWLIKRRGSRCKCQGGPVGTGWERLADMKRVAESTYTWRSKRVLHADGLGLRRKDREGVFW